jgi:hypothetical protein
MFALVGIGKKAVSTDCFEQMNQQPRSGSTSDTILCEPGSLPIRMIGHINFSLMKTDLQAQFVGRLCETAFGKRRLTQTPYNRTEKSATCATALGVSV